MANIKFLEAYLILLILCCLLGLSCTEEHECLDAEPSIVVGAVPVDDCVVSTTSPCDPHVSKANIRIRNFSRYDICDMQYSGYYGIEKKNYETIMSGECTCFISHERAYRYPASMTYTDHVGEHARGAIDFVGERRLKSGWYDYNLRIIKTPLKEYFSAYMAKSNDKHEYYDAIAYRCPETKPKGCEIDPDRVNVRIVNESIFQLCSFTYENVRDELIEFGSINSGETTCYVPLNYFDKRNERITFEVNGVQLSYGLTRLISKDVSTEGNYSVYLTMGSLDGESIFTIVERDD